MAEERIRKSASDQLEQGGKSQAELTPEQLAGATGGTVAFNEEKKKSTQEEEGVKRRG